MDQIRVDNYDQPPDHLKTTRGPIISPLYGTIGPPGPPIYIYLYIYMAMWVRWVRLLVLNAIQDVGRKVVPWSHEAKMTINEAEILAIKAACEDRPGGPPNELMVVLRLSYDRVEHELRKSLDAIEQAIAAGERGEHEVASAFDDVAIGHEAMATKVFADFYSKRKDDLQNEKGK